MAVRSHRFVSPQDMERSLELAEQFFSEASGLPTFFNLDGAAIRGIPPEWGPEPRSKAIDANIVETVWLGRGPHSGLEMRVECTRYRDYPVIEWVAWLTNGGAVPTPLISDLQALDATLAGDSRVLWHCNGDYCAAEGYTASETPLEPGARVMFAPSGGRSCDHAFPYYRIKFAEGGISMAVGWPGQWAASFEAVVGGLRVRAGQETTELRLTPGQSIRTPRITLMAWSGNSVRAVNLWRRWYLAHVLPRPNGERLRPLLACAGTDEGEEFTAATEENQLRFMDKFRRAGLDFDVWWIDAGWYPCFDDKGERRWWITGSWEPEAARFPNGFTPISQHAEELDAKLLVWFEPERVQPGTRLDKEHDSWLLRAKESADALLYLGNPEARQWLTDHVCRQIQVGGIGIYRQDHNFPPLAHWRENDAPDRQGMSENLHVQGYLQYWDDILARNPGVWIDSCASGGRRNDLETMRRSVPLHYTDFGYGDHPVKLAFHQTMFEWIPYFKECTLAWDVAPPDRFDPRVDSFSFHCGMAAMLFATVDIRRDDYDLALAAKMVGVWRQVADLMLSGDFYPLTPSHRSADKWVAWQFDSPETGRGFVQGVRLAECPAESLTVRLHALEPEATYAFKNPETGESATFGGAELADKGFTFALPLRSGAVWQYRRM